MRENPKAPAVRALAALLRKRERLATGRFLVEGPQCVRELLRHRPHEAERVLMRPGDTAWQSEIAELCRTASVRLEYGSERVLSAVSDTVQPQGVVAVARMAAPTMTETLRGARLVAILHEVRDPGNAGAVLRAADAAGADAVLFSGDSIDPWHPKVVRATTGSLFHLPVVRIDSIDDARRALNRNSIRVVAADVSGEDLRSDEPGLRSPTAWVFGNEARGLDAAVLATVDASRRLPIYGSAESLNLATAASVCLYLSAFAQRQT